MIDAIKLPCAFKLGWAKRVVLEHCLAELICGEKWKWEAEQNMFHHNGSHCVKICDGVWWKAYKYQLVDWDGTVIDNWKGFLQWNTRNTCLTINMDGDKNDRHNYSKQLPTKFSLNFQQELCV